ncbi:MAG: hypothetical protein Q7V58_17670 [Actinomycetota bacterium]|nr:hypothetical protein [Actinomycetota bacterium]
MDDVGGERQEVVLVTRAVPAPSPGPLDVLLGVMANSVGMVTTSASTLASVIEHTVGQAVESSVTSALDRLVPAIADAIVERLDLTSLVLEQVDLNRVVNSALDSLDLTQLVIDRIDVNAIVDQADIERIIDRAPVIPLANYVIEEIDLPQIIRESTGGVATDAVNAIRVQGVGADQLVSRLADRVLLRRRQRKTEAPGEPESLMGRLREDFASDAREEAVGTAGSGGQEQAP